jgi:hypothetical protein
MVQAQVHHNTKAVPTQTATHTRKEFDIAFESTCATRSASSSKYSWLQDGCTVAVMQTEGGTNGECLRTCAGRAAGKACIRDCSSKPSAV